MTPSPAPRPIKIRVTLLEHETVLEVISGQSALPLPSVSGMKHVLADLVRLSLSMVTGGMKETADFDLEPDSLSLECTRRGTSEILDLSFTRVEEITGVELGRYGTAACNVDDLGRAVLDAAEAVLQVYGPHEYRRRWNLRFPIRAAAALRAALGEPGPSFTGWDPVPDLPPWQ